MATPTPIEQQRIERARNVPTHTPDGKAIVVLVAGARGTGFRTVDRTTGRLGGSTFTRDLAEQNKQWQVIGTLASELAREERREQREISQKEADVELQRQAEGKPAKLLTQPGAGGLVAAGGGVVVGGRKAPPTVEVDGRTFSILGAGFIPEPLRQAGVTSLSDVGLQGGGQIDIQPLRDAQGTLQTLEATGRDVTIGRGGLLTFEEEGRITTITPSSPFVGASGKVGVSRGIITKLPKSAEVNLPELFRMVQKQRERTKITVTDVTETIGEPLVIGDVSILPSLADEISKKDIQHTTSTNIPSLFQVTDIKLEDLTRKPPITIQQQLERPIQQTDITQRRQVFSLLNESKFEESFDVKFSKLFEKPFDPTGDIRAAPKREGFLSELVDELEQERFEAFKAEAKGKTTLKSLEVGFGTSLVLSAIGTKQLITDPLKTTKQVGGAVRFIGQRLVSGEGFPEIGAILRSEPGFALGFVGGEVAQAKVGGELTAITFGQSKRLITRLSPKFKKVRKGLLGIETIEDISLSTGKTKLGLIPGGSGLDITSSNLNKLLRDVDIPLVKRPAIPRVSPIQTQILDVIRETGDKAGGSFAQRALLQKEFTRAFADIDIAALDPKLTAKLIGERVSGVDVKRVRITDSPLGEFDIFRVIEKRTGKVIADIDPFKFVEEGLGTKFPTTTIDGLEFLSPKARLGAKVKQLARGKTKGGKVTKDITQLTGGKVRIDTPLVRGGFGFTAAEQQALVGKTGPLTTSARDFFKPFKPKVKVVDDLFVTPFDPLTGIAQTRKSRLALPQKRASILDILRGDVTFKKQKPQIIIFPDQEIGDIFKITPSSELEALATSAELAKRGLIIRKTKKVATTIIDKKVVPIFEADIVKASKDLQRLTKQADAGIISTVGKRELGKLFKAETGFDISISRPVRTTPLISIGDVSISGLVPITKAVKVPSRISIVSPIPSRTKSITTKRLEKLLKVSTPVSRAPVSRSLFSLPVSTIPTSLPTSRLPTSTLISTLSSTPPVSTPVSSPPVSRPPLSLPFIPPPTSIPPSTPPKVPPPTPPLISFPQEDKRPKKQKAYNVFVKDKGKFIKTNKKPLTKRGALGMGAYLSDHSTAAQFKVKEIKTGKKPKAGKFPNYFSANAFKFRSVRRRLKREKGIISMLPPDQFIEKRTFRIDTKGEKEGLSLARLRSKLRKENTQLATIL